MQFSTGEVSGKRLELLREMVPKLARVVTFYNPQNASSIESAKEGREAARVLGIDFLERHVSTPDELEAALEAFRPGDADAYVAVADALVESRSDLVVEMAQSQTPAHPFHPRTYHGARRSRELWCELS